MSGVTCCGRDEQARVQVRGEQRQLAALWRECDAVQADLAAEVLDRRALRGVEARVTGLYQGAAAHIRTYSRLRGGPTSEGEVVRSTLAISRRDLAWLRSHRRVASERQITERLRHELRGSSNALTLLRWSWF